MRQSPDPGTGASICTLYGAPKREEWSMGTSSRRRFPSDPPRLFLVCGQRALGQPAIGVRRPRSGSIPGSARHRCPRTFARPLVRSGASGREAAQLRPRPRFAEYLATERSRVIASMSARPAIMSPACPRGPTERPPRIAVAVIEQRHARRHRLEHQASGCLPEERGPRVGDRIGEHRLLQVVSRGALLSVGELTISPFAKESVVKILASFPESVSSVQPKMSR